MASTEEIPKKKSQKREDCISWKDYFMATAFLAAKRSKDPVRQVGACIVNSDNIIVGVGYNGFPKGCSDDEFPWGKDSDDPLENKKFYVCHAEVNAILNKNSQNTKDCIMYVTLFPCNECAKFIIQSGIKEIIYVDIQEKKKTEAAKKMFDAAKVMYRKFKPDISAVISINFNVEKENAEMHTSPPKTQCLENRNDFENSLRI